MQRSSARRSGRAGLWELVVWDSGLLLLVGLLWLADRQLAPRPQAEPAARPSAGAASPAPSASPGPSRAAPPRAGQPGRERGPRRVGGGAVDEEQARARLAPSRAALDAGRVEEARRLLEALEEPVRMSVAGRDLARALDDAAAGQDRFLTALVQAQLWADRGRSAPLQAALAGWPEGAERQRLAAELEWARARERQGDPALALSEFRPGERRTDGRRAALTSSLPEVEARAGVDALDALLVLAEQVGLSGLPPLQAFLLEPGAAARPQVAAELTTWRREAEPAAERLERLRWAAACWAVERALPGLEAAPAWLREALPRLLAGWSPAAGPRPQATLLGAAWRRLALSGPLRRERSWVATLLQRSTLEDPLPAWALLSAVCFEPEAEPQRRQLRAGLAALARGERSAILSDLDPGASARLESVTLAWLEGP